MSLNYSNNIIADVRCTGSRLQKGVGQYLLQFVLLFEIRAWTDQVLRFENAIAKVFVGASQSSFAVLGVAVPESPVFVRTTPHSRTAQWSFEISLSPTQLAELETIRNGADLHFKFHLYGESFGAHEPLPAHDDLHFLANQSEWIKQLRDAGFTEVLLFEIPIPPTESDESLRTAVQHAKRARELFLAGHYEESVAKCRLSLEAMAKALKQEDQQAQATAAFVQRGQRCREMLLEERMLLLREALRHCTHLAHHDLTTEVISQYSRVDAITILGVTAALLTRACHSVRQKEA